VLFACQLKSRPLKAVKFQQHAQILLDRDRILFVTINDDEIVVTTTGTKITIPASAAAIEKFVDDLANHVESNFVSIATTRGR
jgi:hypothetical protein